MQIILLNYSRSVSIEQPMLDKFHEKIENDLNLWMNAFNEGQFKKYQQKTQNNCSNLECIETQINSDYIYYMSTAPEDMNLNIIECLIYAKKECNTNEDNETIDSCSNETLKKEKCIAETYYAKYYAHIIAPAYMINLNEKINILDNIASDTINMRVTQFLILGLDLSISTRKISDFRYVLNHEDKKCQEKYNESLLNKIEIEEKCIIEKEIKISQIKSFLEQNRTDTPPIKTNDCTNNNILKIKENQKNMIQHKINNTANDYLKILRLMDLQILNNCNFQLYQMINNDDSCTKSSNFLLTYHNIAQTYRFGANMSGCISNELKNIRNRINEWEENEME